MIPWLELTLWLIKHIMARVNVLVMEKSQVDTGFAKKMQNILHDAIILVSMLIYVTACYWLSTKLTRKSSYIIASWTICFTRCPFRWIQKFQWVCHMYSVTITDYINPEKIQNQIFKLHRKSFLIIKFMLYVWA